MQFDRNIATIYMKDFICHIHIYMHAYIHAYINSTIFNDRKMLMHACVYIYTYVPWKVKRDTSSSLLMLPSRLASARPNSNLSLFSDMGSRTLWCCMIVSSPAARLIIRINECKYIYISIMSARSMYMCMHVYLGIHMHEDAYTRDYVNQLKYAYMHVYNYISLHVHYTARRPGTHICMHTYMNKVSHMHTKHAFIYIHA